jgi:hypothetical protein
MRFAEKERRLRCVRQERLATNYGGNSRTGSVAGRSVGADTGVASAEGDASGLADTRMWP